MADDIFEEEEGAAPPSSPRTAGVDWALLAASRDKANAFLDHQSRYLELQMEDLHEQRDLTLSHLKLRRISDYVRVGWQSLAAVALIAVMVVIGIAIVQASRAHDLVIDPFSVPSDVAAQGLGGEQAANAFSARLNQISINDAFYAQRGETYRESAAGDIKVVIPQTGISIGELNQYLRSLLGDETHLSGQIMHRGKALVLLLHSGTSGMTVTQPDGDLDKLIQSGAEAVFAADRPLRYVEYLRINNRIDEALGRVVLPSQIGSDEQRAAALANWSLLLFSRGDIAGATAKVQAAAMLDPSSPLPFVYMGYANLLRQQIALDNLETAVRLWTPARLEPLGPVSARLTVLELEVFTRGYKGDFAGAAAASRDYREFNPGPDSSLDDKIAQEVSWDIYAHDIPAAREAAAAHTDNPALALWQEAQIAFALGDWARTAALSAQAFAANPQVPGPALGNNAYGRWAVALAHRGDARGAAARLAQIPFPQCDACDLTRG